MQAINLQICTSGGEKSATKGGIGVAWETGPGLRLITVAIQPIAKEVGPSIAGSISGVSGRVGRASTLKTGRTELWRCYNMRNYTL